MSTKHKPIFKAANFHQTFLIVKDNGDEVCITRLESDADMLVKCVNLMPEIVLALDTLCDAISQVDTSNNSTRVQEILGKAETMANDVSRRAKSNL